jgi:hypothetical protein
LGVGELTSDFLKSFELLNSKLQNSGTFKSKNWIPAQAYLRRSPRAGMTASIEKWLFDNVIAIRLWRRSSPAILRDCFVVLQSTTPRNDPLLLSLRAEGEAIPLFVDWFGHFIPS